MTHEPPAHGHVDELELAGVPDDEPDEALRREVAAQVADVFREFRPLLLARLETLAAAAQALAAGRLSETARLEAERAAHHLAGSLGTFGLAAGSQAAREAERLLRHGPHEPDRSVRLRALVSALRRELAGDG